jgi:hypothetical protein
MANKINEEMVRFLVAQYIGKNGNDATENNIGYFVNFSDPIAYEKQMGTIILAVYAHARKSMQDSGRADVTPSNLLSYMRDIAQHYSTAFGSGNLPCLYGRRNERITWTCSSVAFDLLSSFFVIRMPQSILGYLATC